MTFEEANNSFWKRTRSENLEVFGIKKFCPKCYTCSNNIKCIMFITTVDKCRFYKKKEE